MLLEAVRPMKVGSKIVLPGESFSPPEGQDFSTLIRRGRVKKARGTPEIRKAGPAWRKVFVGDEQIGKAVKTDEEAQAIVESYMNGENP